MAQINEKKLTSSRDRGITADEFLNWMVFDFLNEEEIEFEGDDLFKDEELLPVFLDWLCESIDLREDQELVAIIERDSGYKYVIEDGGNQSFI